MGQAASSCAPSIIFNGVVKVLLTDGSLEIYTRPVKAAELMLEYPGHFVCDSSRHLVVGHRVMGLVADEELERRQMYYLLPMEMLYSVLTSEEMGLLTHKASKALKNGNLSLSKILLGELCIFPLLSTNITASNSGDTKNMQTQEGSGLSPELTKRTYSRQRSWMPALETILETPTPHS